jgi:hypothetical protein
MTQAALPASDPIDLSALDMVDLDQYPLDQPGSALYRQRIAEARDGLLASGCCVLPKLVKAERLAHLAEETRGLAGGAFFAGSEATVYGGAPNPDYPDGHPFGTRIYRENGFVAGDRISPETRIRRLFHAPAFRDFIAACIGIEAVYEFADPLADLVVSVLKPGNVHGWHFDTNEFVVTLITQTPEEGGTFEYSPGLRSPENENHDGVGAILKGERERVKSLDLRAGDLQIFFGRFSLHRVAPVTGGRERHAVIFAYAKSAGMIGNPEKTKKIFGRVSDDHQQDGQAFIRADGLNDGGTPG